MRWWNTGCESMYIGGVKMIERGGSVSSHCSVSANSSEFYENSFLEN